MMSVVVVLLVGVPLNYYYYEEENKMMMNKVDPNTERFALWAQNRRTYSQVFEELSTCKRPSRVHKIVSLHQHVFFLDFLSLPFIDHAWYFNTLVEKCRLHECRNEVPLPSSSW